VREQIVEDDASGLILQFECENGRTRLIIAGASLPFGNRESFRRRGTRSGRRNDGSGASGDRRGLLR
jgi:hypothetical protein